MRTDLLLRALFVSLLLLATAASAANRPLRFGDDLIVNTRHGPVQGSPDALDTWSWKGIPYAEAPVGELRWRRPHRPNRWHAVRAADAYGSDCLQPEALGRFSGSEDCLYLNVWRPRSHERLPVVVWIHGGSNVWGSGRGSWYTVAHHYNAVVVTINYRLGPLGWFSHPALKNGSLRDRSGNYGTLDQIEALRWVRRNIIKFGGDPRNVTIAGESAGAQNVSYLLHSRLAKHLFHKAMVQSNFPGIRPVEAAYKSSKQVLYNLIVADDRGPLADIQDTATAKDYVDANLSDRDVRDYLRNKPAGDIIDAYWTPAWGLINWGDFNRDDIPPSWQGPDRPEFVYAIGDGLVLPGHVAFADFSPGAVFPKPLIVGTTRNENNFWNAYWPFNYRQNTPLASLVEEALQDPWLATFGTDAAEFMRSYKYSTELIDELTTYLGAHLSARNLAQSFPDLNVYVYRFDWGSDPAKEYRIPQEEAFVFYVGALHGAELDFFHQKFGELALGDEVAAYQYTDANLPGRQALARDVGAYLREFIHNRDGSIPKTADQPVAWQPWTADQERFLVFDADWQSSHVEMSDAVARTTEELYADHLTYPNFATVDFIDYYVLWSWHFNWFPTASVGPFDTSPGPNSLFDPADP